MSDSSASYDVAIIGGGIVGLATAMALGRAAGDRAADFRLIVLEAEGRLAQHQTGHNSGVIHSGLYYKPGSLKATLCTSGRNQLYAFCKEHGVTHDPCGKLVVATDDKEIATLKMLAERGEANGLDQMEWLDSAGMREREPNVSGVAGLWVPQTGIVDYVEVAQAYAKVIRGGGGQIDTHARVTNVHRVGDEITLTTSRGLKRCRHVINCGGLQSDRVAKMCGAKPQLRIVPFRGEYYELVESRRSLVRNLIYPVPDPQFPFLGVHYTRMVNGGVEAGPNAVLAFKREGYDKFSCSPRDCLDMATYPGLWKLIGKHWRMGMGEWHRSLSKRAFVKGLQKLIPTITGADLTPAGCGVRAQAIEPDGSLVDDFRIIESDQFIHVLNAPSPAATASIAIGQYIAELATKRFQIK